MDVTERFGATIDVAESDPEGRSFFLITREPSVDHDRFMRHLAMAIGGADRVLLHHRNGLAVVLTSHETAEWLKTQSMCALVGGVQVDLDRLQTTLGLPSP